jgi:hypothetical protein
VTSRGVFPTGFALLEGDIGVTDGRDSLKRFDTCNSRANGSLPRYSAPSFGDLYYWLSVCKTPGGDLSA